MTRFTTFILNVAFVVFLVSGCAQEPHRRNTASYFELGLDAEAQGNYAGARESFSRAWGDARDSDVPPAYKSSVLFNLGRMTGYTCEFYQARKLLQEALDMEISLSGTDSSNVGDRLLELARLNFDHEQYLEAVWFYEKGLSVAARSGVEKNDPIFFANMSDELAKSYQQSGQSALAVAAMHRAVFIRMQHPGQEAKLVPVRYPKTCQNEYGRR